MRDRLVHLHRIRSLDPDDDHLTIYQIMLRYEFPWDMKLGLNLAFNRSFSIPEIAAVHAATGELTKRTQQRIDDTGLLMYEIVLNGFEQPRGRDALRRFYLELGRRMGITDIPDSYQAVEAWFDGYDRAQLRPNDDAAAIERATRMLMLNRLPAALAPMGNALVSAIYDPPLRAATRVANPPWPARVGLHLALRARAHTQRWLGRPPAVPLFADGIKTKTYPNGYDITQLGPSPPAAAGDTPAPD
ncbi:oxygenase MpaB family protein [Salinispora fenicalii]|uniref:oxygenase MpaB family protein n=1 Tax=Salinispora fenicalii TaxID=1137263 RepID=UPI0004809899|nr:oxygenase MpaB family protein [Salinispora fenicalii]